MAGSEENVSIWSCANITVLPKSSPSDLIEEGGVVIIVIYTIVALVLAVMFGLYYRFIFSPLFASVSQPFRPSLIFLNNYTTFLALFSSVTLLLPASSEFTVALQRTIFSLMFLIFMQVTFLQMGGQKGFLNQKESKVLNLAVSPFCCFMCAPGAKRPLSLTGLTIIRWLVGQMIFFQFFILYVTMCLSVSGEFGYKGRICFKTIELLSYIAGIWGLSMLEAVVGKDLEHTRFSTRIKTLRGLATILILQNIILIQCLGGYDVFPCYSPNITGDTIAAFIEAILVIFWCLLTCLVDHKIYMTVNMDVTVIPTTENTARQDKTGIENTGYDV